MWENANFLTLVYSLILWVNILLLRFRIYNINQLHKSKNKLQQNIFFNPHMQQYNIRSNLKTKFKPYGIFKEKKKQYNENKNVFFFIKMFF
jgi:hypothetical protein